MNDQELYQYIDDYLNDLLSEKERETFEQKLQSDSSFKEEYELHKDLQQQLIKREEVEGLKQLVNEVTSQPEIKTNKKWLLAVVLVVLGLIAAIWYFYFQEQPSPKGKEIYIAYYEKYPPYPILRNTQDPTPLMIGTLAYIESDYQKAIKAFDTQGTKDTSNVLSFYKAMTHLEIGQYGDAENILKDLGNEENGEFIEAILWYRSLLLLRKEEADSAKIFMDRIKLSNGKYGKLSKEILLEHSF